MLDHLPAGKEIEVFGFDTDESVVAHAEKRLRRDFPNARVTVRPGDFLKIVTDFGSMGVRGGLFPSRPSEMFDIVIANPPYVRTQIMGAAHAKKLSLGFRPERAR
ncbi:MAG: class I SAM-dependent methyltransferase [Deltaproteobacteria bacterium]|nr:class I SAM-dependent methyltransferase [Deltaproteobacteria bacterium]